MPDLGRSITDASKFLAGIHADAASLFRCISERLEAKGWFIPPRTFAYSGGSRSPTSLSGSIPPWLSAYFCRTSGKPAKPDTALMPWAFFNIYFVPAAFDEPVALWGHISFTNPASSWAVWNPVFAIDEGPEFLNELNPEYWKTPMIAGAAAAEYKSCKLVELSSAGIVEDRVIKAWMKRLNVICETPLGVVWPVVNRPDAE